MSQVLAGAVLVAFVVMWLTALIALLACVFFAIKAIRRACPGVNLWGRDTLWNPANVLLRSTMLTDEGLRYRRKSLKSLGIFIACAGGMLLLAAITGQLK
ncbi:MAG: hypothetical protein KGJ32_15070 [Xanthomonadaceae bacterium]|nr:hypothetical protein [Xanthomonadaceae bacterium]